MVSERPKERKTNNVTRNIAPDPISDTDAEAKRAAHIAESEAESAELIEKHRADKYKEAEAYAASGKYTKALSIYKLLSEITYRDAQRRAEEIEPLALAQRKKRKRVFLTVVAVFVLGIVAFHAINPRIQAAIIEAGAEAREAGRNRVELHSGIVAVNRFGPSTHVVGVLPDGTVIADGSNFDRQLNVGAWEGIIAVTTGRSRTVGLRADGTVVSTRRLDDDRWYDIVMLASGEHHVVGLRADGTVVAEGQNDNGQLDVHDWQDIVAIAAGQFHTVGLRYDGTVVTTGKPDWAARHLEEWQDIVAIDARSGFSYGLRADGTVIETGAWRGLTGRQWRNIVAISSSSFITVGLRADGTVVTAGRVDLYSEIDVSQWQDIVYVAAGMNVIVGLKADGTVVTATVADRARVDVDDWRLYVPAIDVP